MLTPTNNSIPIDHLPSARLYGLGNTDVNADWVTLNSPYHQAEVCFQLEVSTANAFNAMAIAAKHAGIAIGICSAYRSFERQLAIWNAKASGKRALLDANGQAISSECLTDDALIDAILCWSALPGASRHHWGTDIDVFDANQINVSKLQLVQQEYTASGPCGQLHAWLVAHSAEFGFYFPYQAGKSGVSPEPWHLSYAPKSQVLLTQFSAQDLASVLKQSDILLKPAILSRLDKLVDEYVFRVATP